MTRSIKLILLAIIACVFQTNLVGYIRIAGIAPDMLIVFLTLLSSYVGPYGGFCVGSVLAMFYDASVGYVLAINLVGYTFIGWAAPMLYRSLDQFLRILKHKSILVKMMICFFLTFLREMLYLGYLFLIGAELINLTTVIRLLMCSGYSAALIWPCSYIVKKVMNWQILPQKKKKEDLQEL